MDTAFRTIQELGDLLKGRQVSSVDLTRAALTRIDELDETLGAFLTVTHDVALLQARKADARLSQGQGGPLTGIPMALKDVLSTRGVRTTCGSRILETYVPQYSATAVNRLEEAGAVLLGKTNMDEFAMGSSTENSGFGPTKNPWDTDRVPGGSSGGSAAAVAAGLAVYALGTDTGGSVRQPASFTGTVGLKPTYGRVSRFGLVAFASSLDQIGTITRSVSDAATVLQTIAGHDPLDSTSVDAPVPGYPESLSGSIAGLKLGVPREYFSEGLSAEVDSLMRAALHTLEELGATLVDVSLPHTEYGISTYYVIAPAEAMANLARYDGVRYGLSAAGDDIWEMFERSRELGFGTEVKRRILLGTYALSAGYYDAYYLTAQKVRTLVAQDFHHALQDVDAIVGPTAPTVPFRLGEKTADPLQMYLSDVYSVPASLAGVPAVSVPAGFSNRLPVGLQIIGKPFDEATILRIADAFERVTGFDKEHPNLPAGAAAA